MMAARAIIITLVVKQWITPIFGAMAIAALPVIRMAGWRFSGMAAQAVGKICVVESDGGPTACIVAAAALPFVMFGWLIDCVALLAVRVSGVIKRGVGPIAGVGVAVGAGAVVMALGRFDGVAAFALVNAQMIKRACFPGCYVCMTAHTIPGKVDIM